jgi:hypothetical protein
VFERVLHAFCGDERDPQTVALLAAAEGHEAMARR